MLQLYLSLILDPESQGKFEQIYRQYRQTMFWVAQQILHDEALSEDAVHDAFLRIINHLENISPENCNKTRSFVVIIVRNIALDYIRMQKKLAETNLDDYEDMIQSPDSDPEHNWLIGEGSKQIVEALKKLKQSYVDVLALRMHYELDDKEIAQLLNISPENVRVKLHRGRSQLIRILKKDD